MRQARRDALQKVHGASTGASARSASGIASGRRFPERALAGAWASGPEPPVARALCVAVAEEASDATQPWPAASSNCVAGLGAAPGSPRATVGALALRRRRRRPFFFDRRAAWRRNGAVAAMAPTHHDAWRCRETSHERSAPSQNTRRRRPAAKVGLAGDASISEVIAPLQQHLASDAETGVLAVKAACT